MLFRTLGLQEDLSALPCLFLSGVPEESAVDRDGGDWVTAEQLGPVESMAVTLNGLWWCVLLSAYRGRG